MEIVEVGKKKYLTDQQKIDLFEENTLEAFVVMVDEDGFHVANTELRDAYSMIGFLQCALQTLIDETREEA